MDLYADWIDFLKTRLQEMNCPANEADTPEQVSLGYFNLLKRRILPRPRKNSDIKRVLLPSRTSKRIRED